MSLLPVLTGILVMLCVVALWIGVRTRTRDDSLAERLSQLHSRERSLDDLEMTLSFAERVLRPSLHHLVRRLGRLMPSRNVESVQRKLELAGRPHNLTVSDFLGLRIGSAIIVGSLTAILTLMQGHPLIRVLLLSLGSGAAGSLIPSYWLRRQARARQEEIQRALPDALDMLTISVTAGLGLDSAMRTIAQKWDNAVADEFDQTVREMQVGVPRAEALRAMAQRTDVKEMSNFIAVLVQADQLGLTISNVLKTQSDQMRLMRRQRAEELASKAPIKMLFPLVFLIFPSIFAVILGPAIPRLAGLFDTL